MALIALEQTTFSGEFSDKKKKKTQLVGTLNFRRELQLHLSACEERQRECSVAGCHFWGNASSLAHHKKEKAEKHVALLQEERVQLQSAIISGVSNL